ncbi:MAG: DUF2169 domain-containing protein [Polyangiaceae bacterium]
MSVVRVLPLTPVAHGSRVFQAAGRVGVSVVVKVAYALVSGGVARRMSIATMTREDLAPYRPFADVVFRGRAYAPSDTPVPAMAVRLTLARGQKTLLDKRLIVSGDRVHAPGRSAPAATPFLEMPIVWERALGGDGFDLNPVGIGAAPDSTGARRLPNLSYPGVELQMRPACFAPLPPNAPARLRFLGARRDEVLGRAVPDLTDAMQYGYFQAAPPDQQIAFLRGDETIRLEGLTKAPGAFVTELPNEVALARAYVPASGATPLELVADGLDIDGDALTASITWRGCFTALDLDMLRQMIVAVAIQPAKARATLGDHSLQWPEPALVESFYAALNAPALEEQRTMELSQPAHIAAARTETVPFKGGDARRRDSVPEPASIPGSPWATRPSLNPVEARDVTQTIEIEDLSPATRRALLPGSSDFAVGMPKSATPAPRSARSPRSTRRKASHDPWAKIDETPAPEVKPPQPRPPEKPSARAILYQKISKK